MMKHRNFKLVSTLVSENETADNTAPSLSQAIEPHGYQLSLPFDDERILTQIFIVPMDHIHGVKFCKLILDLKPRKVVDLRHLIRFDLPGTSRKEIFRNLSIAHTLYIKASLPWHQLKPRDFMLEGTTLSHQLNHELVEREDTPLILLASKKDEVRYITAYLHRIMSIRARRPWKIEQLL